METPKRSKRLIGIIRPAGYILTARNSERLKILTATGRPSIPLKNLPFHMSLTAGSGAEGADYSPQGGGAGRLGVAAAAAPVKEGCIFAGWESGGKIYQPGDAVAVEGDIVLNALWQSAPDYISITVEKRWKLDDGGTARRADNCRSYARRRGICPGSFKSGERLAAMNGAIWSRAIGA